MGEDRTEDAQQGEPQKQYVTVGEAAKLLGVHRNTVHHRIKAGRITAHKVVEGEREVYRIELDSLGVGRTRADVHTLDAQRTMAGEELSRMIATRLDEIVRDYMEQLGAIREELGGERARRQMAETTLREGMAEERRRREQAEQERDKLRWELETIRAGLESPERRKAAPVRAVQQPHPDVAGSQTPAQRPQRKTLRDWTRSLFGR
jgi:excisionase family DNA binding protein